MKGSEEPVHGFNQKRYTSPSAERRVVPLVASQVVVRDAWQALYPGSS